MNSATTRSDLRNKDVTIKAALACAACVIAPLIIPIAYAAKLSIPYQAANAGETIVASMALLSGGQLISGVQFDVTWDQSLAVQIAIGAQIGQSNKVLYTASPSLNVMRC